MTLGEVLKSLARRRKLGAYKIARALDVYHTTVYDWWQGTYRPSPEKLRAYAALMEVSVEDIEQQAISDQDRRTIAARVFAILERISEGADPAAAFTAVTGSLVSADQRTALSGAAQQFKAYLSAEAGVDWDQASPAAREAILRSFREELLGELPPPTTP